MRLVMPTLLGMEALVARELEAMGYTREQMKVLDGQVYLELDDRISWSQAIARIHLQSRCAERVEWEVLRAKVSDFDTLFQVVEAYPWEEILPRGANFVIAGGYSRKSKLFGIPACQRLIHKAILKRLYSVYHLPEQHLWKPGPDQAKLRFQFSFLKDQFSLRLDLTGTALHKRGYRLEHNEAPLKETIASALYQLVRFQPFANEALWDPFCGSGTLLIEAALQIAELAPGLHRHFSAEDYPFIDTSFFVSERELARQKMDLTPPDQIFLFGTDKDPKAIQVAKNNAKRAGVEKFIHFEVADLAELDTDRMIRKTGLDYLTILTNPPYGERLLDEEQARQLMKLCSRLFFQQGGLRPAVRFHVFTADPELERIIGYRADRRRKLYNGMIACQFYQYTRKTQEKLPAPRGREKR